MQMTKIVQSVYDRLSGDTGVGGLFASGAELVDGVYSFRAGSQVSQGDSYIVTSITGGVQQDSFDADLIDWSLSVSVFIDPQEVSGVGLSAIVDRVYARLHRWTPTLDGWTASGPWTFTDAGAPELPDEDSLQWIMNFELIANKAV